MIVRWLTGAGYWLAVAVLSMAVIGLGVFLAASVVAPEVDRAMSAAVASSSPSSPSTPAPTPTTVAPMRVPIPASAQCKACHGTGDPVAVEVIPVMAHPVQGWTDCTACHADDRLVKTAPGHSGIHKDLCLACHKEPSPDASASALPRPHHIVPGTACITCHGSKAPLPTDMAGRANCWICHPNQENEDLFGIPMPSAAPAPTVAPVKASPGAPSAPPSPSVAPASSPADGDATTD
jgi:hypothetical protein